MPPHPPFRRLLRATALLLCVVLATAGCRLQGLNFLEDTRVQIVAPGDREQVALPLTLEWDVTDFSIAGPDEIGAPDADAGYFGIFFDRSPPPPGEPLSWLARDDGSCVAARGCPDAEWFEQRRIYTTTDTSFIIDQLPARSDDRREFHEVTIVLLDPSGRRIGESAFAVEFEVVRGS